MTRPTGKVSRLVLWVIAATTILGTAAFYRSFYLSGPSRTERLMSSFPVPVVERIDPLAVPDYAGGPEFDVNADLTPLIQEARQTAMVSKPQILSKRKEAVDRFPLGGLLVPINLTAKTQQQADDEYFRYRLRELEAYQKLTADGPNSRQAGERFLRAYMEQASDVDNAPQPEEVWKLGQAALEAGCRDPLVRIYSVHSQVLARRGFDGVEKAIVELLPLLSQSHYPRMAIAFARIRLSECSRWKENQQVHALSPSPAPNKNLWPAAVVAIVRWLEQDAEDPQWRQSVHRRFLSVWEMCNDYDRLHLLAGLLQSKTIDPWLIYTILGNYEIKVGWQARGTSIASEVNEEKWKDFHEHLSTASICLQYAWHLHPELPQPAASMITVAMAGGDGEKNPHEWFLRTIEAQFDYLSAYNQMRNSLRPRWGGSVREMIEFGKRCLETDRFDTCVPTVLPEILEVIRTEELEKDQTLAKDTDAQVLLRRFLARRDEYRRTHPNKPVQIDISRQRTRLAVLLQRCELHAEAVEEFKSLGDKVDIHQLRSDGETAAFDLSVLLAAQGEEGPKVRALANTLRRSWNHQATPEAMLEIESSLKSLSQTASHPRAKLFYRHAETMLKQLKDYSTGNWVSLTFDPELLGWEIYADEWKLDEEQSALRLSCRNGLVPRLHLRALAAFRPPFIVEADVEVLDPHPFPRSAGIHFATESFRKNQRWEQQQPLFGIDSKMWTHGITNVVSRHDFAWYPFVNQQELFMSQFELPTVGPHRLRVKLWDKAYEFRIDDDFRSGIIFDGLDPAAGLCFGEAHPVGSSEGRNMTFAGELRMSNMRIRRLDIPSPPTKSSSTAEQQSYWEMRLAADADDPRAQLELAWILFAQQRGDDAVSYAQRALQICPRIERAHGLIGRIHFDAGRLREAVAELELVCKELHVDPVEYATLAEIKSTAPDDDLRNAKRAMDLAEFAERSQRLSQQNHWQVFASLAAAHAESGQFDKAMEWNTRAIEMTEGSTKASLESRQELYKSKKPFRRMP